MKLFRKKIIWLYCFLLAPLWAFAQFVEEQRQKASDFSLRGIETFNTIVDTVNIFLALLFISSILGALFAGAKFIIAGGSESTLGSARKTLLASVIGFVLSLVGYIIINMIKYFLT